MVVGSVAGDSATLSLPAGTLTGSAGLVGSGSGAVGVATVSGSGIWTNNGSLTVGQSGTGTLSITEAGLVRVGGTAGNGTLTLASGSGSRGTLNIGSGGLSGTLQAGIVTGGSGTATVNFNHTSGSYAFAPRLTGTLAVTHAGPGRTVLSGSNTFTGPTTVAQGTLQLGNAGALSSSAVTVAAGATLAVSPQVAAAVPALANNGLVDVGLGGLTVTSGQTAAALMAGIGAGRNGGTWDGATGITSTAAAGMTDRAVGWIDNGGGSFTVGFAAAGDLDMNGLVDLDDVIAFVSSSLYDTGLPSVWAQGDYDYNSIVDLDDVIAFVSGGLYDAGPYNAAPAGMSLAGLADDPSLMNGGFAAVPEPASWVLAALGAGMAAGWRRRLAVSSSACRRR
jgi:autotransporter-associated beta strand protein/T5SS/PEP-CTERM-associated repeat protein